MHKGFRDLKVWQEAKDFSVYIYKQTEAGTINKDFGLRDQLRRAAVSIASNIAEGDERESDKKSIRFFYISKGSIAEVITQSIIAFEVGYFEKETLNEIEVRCGKIAGMLTNLIKSRK